METRDKMSSISSDSNKNLTSNGKHETILRKIKQENTFDSEECSTFVGSGGYGDLPGNSSNKDCNRQKESVAIKLEERESNSSTTSALSQMSSSEDLNKDKVAKKNEAVPLGLFCNTHYMKDEKQFKTRASVSGGLSKSKVTDGQPQDNNVIENLKSINYGLGTASSSVQGKNDQVRASKRTRAVASLSVPLSPVPTNQTMKKSWPQPAVSFDTLIALALKNSRKGYREAQDIVNYISKHFPYYRYAADSWKSKALTQLTNSHVFVKLRQSKVGLVNGSLWTLHPAYKERFDAEICKWIDKPPGGCLENLGSKVKLLALIKGHLHELTERKQPPKPSTSQRVGTSTSQQHESLMRKTNPPGTHSSQAPEGQCVSSGMPISSPNNRLLVNKSSAVKGRKGSLTQPEVHKKVESLVNISDVKKKRKAENQEEETRNLNDSQNKKKRQWVDPAREKGNDSFITKLYQDLVNNERKFYNFVNMSHESFLELLKQTEDQICHIDTNFKTAIPPNERLLLTLRYLVTGDSVRSLQETFQIGSSTIRTIVYEVCDALCFSLKETELPRLTEKAFKDISKLFYKKWKYPHCLGAVGFKMITVHIPAPLRAATDTEKGQKKINIVLQGVADSEGNLISVDVVDLDENFQGKVLNQSAFGEALIKSQLPIPKPDKSLISENELKKALPYVFLGTADNQLFVNLMRPYPVRRTEYDIKKLYNEQHNHAREIIEFVFRTIIFKWGVLRIPLIMSPKNASTVALTCCLLHNFLKNREGCGLVIKDSSLASKKCNTDSAMIGRSPKPKGLALSTRDLFAEFFSSRQSPVEALDLLVFSEKESDGQGEQNCCVVPQKSIEDVSRGKNSSVLSSDVSQSITENSSSANTAPLAQSDSLNDVTVCSKIPLNDISKNETDTSNRLSFLIDDTLHGPDVSKVSQPGLNSSDTVYVSNPFADSPHPTSFATTSNNFITNHTTPTTVASVPVTTSDILTSLLNQSVTGPTGDAGSENFTSNLPTMKGEGASSVSVWKDDYMPSLY